MSGMLNLKLFDNLLGIKHLPIYFFKCVFLGTGVYFYNVLCG